MSSHLHVPGAGTLVQLPTDAPDATSAAYVVAPGSHVGRVVTGVVILAETLRRDTTPDVGSSFGLASVAFADKLAEQGYKVLVVAAALAKASEEDIKADTARAERAAAYLKEHQDVQRVALLGYGVGADIALKISMEQNQSAFDCFVALSPEGLVSWEAKGEERELPPLLVLIGEKTPYATSGALQQLYDTVAKNPPAEAVPPKFRSRVFPNQAKGFAFSGITDEDAATQAIAEVLDWLVMHLHRFRVVACTSDTDPWWPQGRNGPFCNIGAQTWHQTRNDWLTPTQPRPPRPPAVPSHLLFDGLSSMRRTFDLPHRMPLGDIVEIFVEIWEVQQ